MKDKEYKKIWQKLKETLIQKYPECCHKADVSNGDWERGELSAVVSVLYHMDKLDETREFSNLLEDMEGK